MIGTAIKTVMTCSACPSQWEITLSDGRMVYGRYRYGWLSMRVSEDATENIYDAVNGEEFYCENHGDGYDGSMTTKKMKSLTKGYIKYGNK